MQVLVHILRWNRNKCKYLYIFLYGNMGADKSGHRNCQYRGDGHIFDSWRWMLMRQADASSHSSTLLVAKTLSFVSSGKAAQMPSNPFDDYGGRKSAHEVIYIGRCISDCLKSSSAPSASNVARNIWSSESMFINRRRPSVAAAARSV